MDSGVYSPPPSFTSGGFKSVEPQYPPSNIHPDPVEVQAPSLSSVGITMNSEPLFPTYAENLVPHDESYVQPVSRSDLRPGVNSFTGGDGDDAGHVNTSEFGLNVYDGHEAAPSHSAMVPENQSNPDVSDASPATDPTENVEFSIPGRHFPRGKLTGLYYEVGTE